MRKTNWLAAWGLLACLVLSACASSSGGAAPTPTATTLPSATGTGSTQAPVTSIHLQSFASGLDSPLFLTYAPGQADRLYVVEQAGRIMIVGMDGSVRSTPFLDIRSLISSGGERGLLSVAFSPNYVQNGTFYVDYTDLNGDTSIVRYKVSSDPNVANASSAQIILHIAQPAANHNGGLLLFGRDGYLYVGMGDGGAGASGNAQKKDMLLGKILRLDVDHLANGLQYGIPADNPFVGQAGVRPEIWAYGLRNPWRFSFDRANGDLYLADVGQNIYEELNYQPAASKGGQNYGWAIFEADSCYGGDSACAAATGTTKPILNYTHQNGNCVITGGYVYRGTRYPSLVGTYLFGDYCSGMIWGFAASQAKSGNVKATKLLDSNLQIASFGEDSAGELYVVSLSGTISKVTP